MKKKTRSQKIAENKPKGKSGYAKKVERRRKLALKLGMERVPLPVLLAAKEGSDETSD
jgi:hypothetical protein